MQDRDSQKPVDLAASLKTLPEEGVVPDRGVQQPADSTPSLPVTKPATHDLREQDAAVEPTGSVRKKRESSKEAPDEQGKLIRTRRKSSKEKDIAPALDDIANNNAKTVHRRKSRPSQRIKSKDSLSSSNCSRGS